MPESVPVASEVAAVHAAAPVLLAHVHMQRGYGPEAIDYVAPGDDLPGRQVDIPKLRRGGVKYIWLSEGAPGEFAVDPRLSQRAKLDPNVRPATRIAFRGGAEAQRLIRGWDAVRRLCDDFAGDLAFARSVKEARAAVARGKVAVFWHTESLLLANDLAVLRAYHGLGLRATGLVHAAPLDWIELGQGAAGAGRADRVRARRDRGAERARRRHRRLARLRGGDRRRGAPEPASRRRLALQRAPAGPAAAQPLGRTRSGPSPAGAE